MNRYAQLLYGKVIYIFETDLKFEQLSTIFDPSTYWVDVTGMDCEVGYLVSFEDNVGLILTPPPSKELTLEEEKAAKLAEVDAWTANKIVGGFVSSCSGEEITYDSDKDTQLTVSSDMATIQLAPDKFAENFPSGYPMRGYPQGVDTSDSSNKVIYNLSFEQLVQWNVDLGLHRGACKQAGWAKQAEVEKATSKEELDAIILE